MGTPLYTTDIIPMTSRPTLTVMDDGDYFVILDTSTGKISKILKTNIMTALKITYDNTTSELTAETVQAALDELVVNLGSSDDAILALAGRLDTLEGDVSTEGSVLKDIKDNAKDATYDNSTAGLTADTLGGAIDEVEGRVDNAENAINVIKGTGYTEGTLKSHEDRLDTLEGTGAGSVAKAIEDLAGSGRTTETVKKNADDIALRELLSNKKTTLTENSDVYFPTQQAVNEGLNRTMAEIMGFAPRNLMDVFGTLTVPATFEALRNYLIASGGCDFSLLRLGDYIDLDSFTVQNWYNGAAYDSSSGAWDTPATVTKNLSYENTRVEIVGFSDYRYVGNTAYPSTPHVTFQFKNIPLTAPMHKLNASPFYSTSQGYTGSDLKTKGLANWYTAIASQFGTATPREVDRIIATSSGYEWCGAEKLFLPTGMNIFGSPGFARADRGVGTQHLFPLYALNPNSRMKKRNGSSRQYWWLAEPSAGSSSAFTRVGNSGGLSTGDSYYSYGVAPAFLI